ncbi:MAG: hypothetical protein NUV76_12905 [Candidatus Kuenenia sp.]|nr:hypothetical protein [Candidatus Kuenenia sp.]
MNTVVTKLQNEAITSLSIFLRAGSIGKIFTGEIRNANSILPPTPLQRGTTTPCTPASGGHSPPLEGVRGED